MEQNSKDWLDWRRTGIGASDAPIIMGKSKYAKPQELFLEKIGEAPPKKVNEYITGLGHRFEPMARAWLNLLLDKQYEPKLVEMSEYPWLRASLDGYDDMPVEIKYVGAKKLELARAGELDHSHWIQMQHQMMVTGSNRCIYCCYTLNAEKNRIDELHHLPVDYNKEYVLNHLWPTEFKFWERVEAKKWM